VVGGLGPDGLAGAAVRQVLVAVLLALRVRRLLGLVLEGLLEFVEGEDEELDIVHIVDAEGLANRVDLNSELLLDRLAGGLGHGLVVDQEGALRDQQLENVLDASNRHLVVVLLNG
jgi:hypothetical protein